MSPATTAWSGPAAATGGVLRTYSMEVSPFAVPTAETSDTVAVDGEMSLTTVNETTPATVPVWTPRLPLSRSGVEIEPFVTATVTSVPSGWRFPYWSLMASVVTAEVETPSARSLSGTAVSVTVPAGTLGTKVTLAGISGMVLGSWSDAVTAIVSATVSVSVATAAPLCGTIPVSTPVFSPDAPWSVVPTNCPLPPAVSVTCTCAGRSPSVLSLTCT